MYYRGGVATHRNAWHPRRDDDRWGPTHLDVGIPVDWNYDETGVDRYTRVDVSLFSIPEDTFLSVYGLEVIR